MKKQNLSRLREWRERRMLSQQDLAEAAGVSVFTVQRVESGRGGAHPSTGRKFAAALNIEPEELSAESAVPLAQAR